MFIAFIRGEWDVIYLVLDNVYASWQCQQRSVFVLCHINHRAGVRAAEAKRLMCGSTLMTLELADAVMYLCINNHRLAPGCMMAIKMQPTDVSHNKKTTKYA